MRATEVVALQNDWVKRWNDSEFFVRYVREILASSWSIKDGKQEAKNLAGRVSEVVAKAFEYGETYMVTPQMTDLAVYAASKLDASDTVDVEMFPSPWGVVRFGTPLHMHDLRGVVANIHWMTWSPSIQVVTNAFGQDIERKGMVVSWWNDMSDPDPTSRTILSDKKNFNPKAVRELGRWSLIGVDHLGHGMRLGEPYVTVNEELVRKALELDEGMESYGIAGYEPPKITAKVDNTIRYAWALILLLNQELVSMTPPRLSKADVKFMRRMPVWNEVRVVDLRAVKHRRDENDPRSVAWSHRWAVRGHWRWQPYGDGTTRRIWIAPHIRGPAHLPFVQTKKVYRLAR